MLAKFSTNMNTAAPTTGPRKVPSPPMMAMTMGRKEVAMPRWLGETKIVIGKEDPGQAGKGS